MARTLTHLLRLSGVLLAEEPLHVGGLDGTAFTDMPVARDGRGRPCIPGTSLAGALFAALGIDESDPARGGARGGRDAGAASRIIVDDAPMEGEPALELWDGVGIDRGTGTAAARVKYDREVIPAGARFAFTLTYEAEGDLPAARAFMGRALRLLESGFALGAGVTRGLGRVRLESAAAVEIDWGDATAVLDFLEGRGGRAARAEWEAAAGEEAADARLEIRIEWRPRLPVMVKAGQDGLATDMLPFVSRLPDGTCALTLPGSGIKGALREQAERIVRTVLGQDMKPDAPLHEMVDQPIVRELFGMARRSTRSRDEDSGPGRGRLRVHTVYASHGRPESEWEALADHGTVPGGVWRAMHVAIDRWTGGAADAFLYSAAEPDPDETTWRPLVLEYRPRQGDDAALHLALLWLVLEDLRAGRIGLGFGRNRGYGEIEITRLGFSGPLAETYRLPAAVEGKTSLLDAPPEALVSAWKTWLAPEGKEAVA